MTLDKNAKKKTLDLYRDGQEEATKRKALDLGTKYFDARKYEVPSDTLALFSEEEAKDLKAMPIFYKNKHIIFGSLDPHKKELLDIVKTFEKHFNVIEFALISEPSFYELLEGFKGLKKIELDKRDDVIRLDIKISSFEELNDKLQNAPIQDLLKMILFTSINAESSDIHIEPQEEDVRIRFRIDGVLHEIARVDKERYNVLLSQIELKAGVKIGAKIPQKGRFNIVLDDKSELSLRIETLPSLYGDDIVMRIFNTRADMLKIQDLGILDEKYNVLKNSLARPHGMIIVVGPTGSGKTSTIYAILNEINSSEVKIITLEDPVEYSLKGITQSQINEGESFGDRLKAVLREDPDTIMVGEIRDPEAASTALQAALTGHLVITTIHANNAITAIVRLSEFGGDPATITTATNLIIAQRLVRKICEKCKQPYEPTDFEKGEAERILNTFPEMEKEGIKLQFFKGEGCQECNSLGYKGRIGIFEFLNIGPELQQAVIQKKTIFELQKLAIEKGMMTMEQDGLVKVTNGTTTIQEIMRAIKE